MTGDYISREAAIAAVDNYNHVYFPRNKRKLEELSAADVRPVVRGKWSVHEIYKHELSYGVTAYEPVYECSACGGWMESYLRYDEPIMPEDADFPRYCPNCGADMREES